MRPSDESIGNRSKPIVLGRYVLCDVIGGGGMAKVHVGRILGAAGFSRVVAIKRLHASHAADPRVAAMMVDEARLVSRIRHPNVVPTLDVVAMGHELLLVMEYVHGLALSDVARLASTRRERLPPAIVSRIIADTLAGLEAAHDATSERGKPLRIVHRDVSPQNVLVGTDGIARIADFGIAKAEGKLAMTQAGQIKGKLAYMAPEQILTTELDHRADVYAVGIMLWELLTGRRLFAERRPQDILRIRRTGLVEPFEPPSTHVKGISAALDAVVMRALEPSAERRFASASDMASALEAALAPATPKEVGAYVAELGRNVLGDRSRVVAAVEQASELNAGDAPITIPDQRAAAAADDVRPARPPIASDPTGSLELLGPAPPPPRPSLAPPIEPTPARASQVDAPSRRTRAWIIAVPFAFIAGGAVLWVATRPRPPAATPPSASAVSTASAPPSAPPPASTNAEPPVAQPPPTPPAPSASASARRRTKPAAPNCDPPYRIDENGIRILRRECLTQ